MRDPAPLLIVLVAQERTGGASWASPVQAPALWVLQRIAGLRPSFGCHHYRGKHWRHELDLSRMLLFRP